MSYILHIDTATDKCTVALSAEGELLAQISNEESRNHAAAVNLMIEELLVNAEIALKDIAAIAVCAGPGSYTGLRIGVATAKGLCFALDTPLMLHNRLTLLAYHPYKRGENGPYMPLLFARDKEFFFAIYDKSFNPNVLPQHISETDLIEAFKKNYDCCIITDLSENSLKNLTSGLVSVHYNSQIDLNSWADFAFQSYQCNNFTDLNFAEPFYLKQVFTHN